ncbi:MAG: hypothetical protein HKN12_03430 [Gemmatimonadetes bacterium]|nr:hypothetical protein [Gemmatimonadota bacterium]
MRSLFHALGWLLLSVAPVGAGVPSLFVATHCDSGGAVGLPDPGRSSFGLSPGAVPCQYRFWADGGLDILTVNVTLRDAFDTPIDSSTVEVHLKSVSGTFCSCEGTVFTAVTDSAGIGQMDISRIGGWGQLDLCVTAEVMCHDQSYGRLAVGTLPITFTSSDLNASCETPVSTNVIDLGWFAAGLSSYVQYADYDCNLQITIVDLGIWAHALDKGCGP